MTRTTVAVRGVLTAAARPVPWLTCLVRHRQLIRRLAGREIQLRYRGSVLGLVWSVLVPVCMLAIYTLVFGSIFKARWTGSDGSTQSYALLVFLGLIVFQFYGENLARAPGLVLENVSYVKKVVFPLDVLPWVTVCVAGFNGLVSLGVLGLMVLVVQGVPVTALLLPVVLGPVVPLALGTSWALAALGVYLRDLRQFVAVLVTALNFMSPVFYPMSALPDRAQEVLRLNPLVGLMENARRVTLQGQQPDWRELAILAVVSVVVAAAGHALFVRLQPGFADVV